LGPGGGALLLVACNPPADVEGAVELLRRSDMVLQVAGVFGASPEDPEPVMERLVDAAAPGSALHLFFGPEYWRRFAALQRRRLATLREDEGVAEAAALAGGEGAGAEDEGGEIVEPKVLEMRLIERIMRECYVEEQRCEQELVCASKVLDRTLVAPEDIQAAMRGV